VQDVGTSNCDHNREAASNSDHALFVAQYVQAISYIATPVRRQLCLAMATRMMPI